MFSGMIRQTGAVVDLKRNRLTVRLVPIKAALGDSIAVNGVCLTVVTKKQSGGKMDLSFDVSEETFDKTTLGGWKRGQTVNVEPALTAADAMGGHIVQGHVDGVGKVARIDIKRSSRVIRFEAPREISKYVVEKGSITVDGVSLTALDASGKSFSVALIPYTWQHTTLGAMKQGDKVNLEADIIGKYVARHLKKK